MAPKEEPLATVLMDPVPSSSSDSSQSTHASDTSLSDEQEQRKKAQAKPLSSSETLSDSEGLWWIHGRAYKLDSFVNRHPGGLEAILLGKGRDCTALVESYHAFSPQHSKILEKYLVRDAVPTEKAATPLASEKDFFYELLKQRVTKVLKEKGVDPVLDRGATLGRTLYYGVIFALTLLSGYAHVKGSLIGSFSFAIFGWLMGALGHDAGHFAASHNYPVLNEWGVWAMTFICNPILWQQQHTYGHHSYTNEFSHDPDLHHFHLFLRVHRKISYQPIFQNQTNFLYVLFAFLFVVFGTCFYIPITLILRGTLYGLVDWHDKSRPTKALGMALHMSLYVGVVMVGPFMYQSSKLLAFAGALIHIATLGIVFAFFSQINHLNEISLENDLETLKETGDNVGQLKRDPRLVDSWAVAQVETSNNFATDSMLWHVLSNGLNHQIEHHLFPGLNHCHLHHISKTVRDTCEEFGVIYKSYDSWPEIMNATLAWYNKLSIDETSAKTRED